MSYQSLVEISLKKASLETDQGKKKELTKVAELWLIKEQIQIAEIQEKQASEKLEKAKQELKELNAKQEKCLREWSAIKNENEGEEGTTSDKFHIHSVQHTGIYTRDDE